MKTKFTPWRVHETAVLADGSVLFQVLAGGAVPVVIAERRVLGDSPGTREAFEQIVREHNSAPELLAALAELLACCVPTGHDTRTDCAMEQARAAIAKATGESV